MKNSNLEIANFVNADGFQNGWYILEVDSDSRHVLWHSVCFSTEEEAERELRAMNGEIPEHLEYNEPAGDE